MAYTPVLRRRRRRRLIWLLVVVGVVVGIAFGVVRAQGERELTREYLDVAFEVSEGEFLAAERFSSAIIEIESFERATLTERLDEIEAEVGRLAQLTDGAEPPADLQRGHVFLQIATVTWRQGLVSAREGLVLLADNPLDEEGLDLLRGGLIDLRVGDSAYRGFLIELADVDTSLHGGDLPDVAFVPGADEHLFDAQELARRLFLTPGLGSQFNLAVADINLEPGPVGERDGLPVVPASGSQAADVTVSNRGNVDAEDIEVSLTVISNTGDLFEARQEIESLGAGELITLTYSDIPVESGAIYEVIATLPGEDDDPDDDVNSFLFSVNPET